MHVLNQRSRTRHRVYFVEAPLVGRWKIGLTSDIESRLRNLKSGSPIELITRLVIKASARDEWAIHGLFCDERVHGEWFEGSPRLRAFVDDLSRAGRNEVQDKLAAIPTVTIRGIRKVLGPISAGARRSPKDSGSFQRHRRDRLFVNLTALLAARAA